MGESYRRGKYLWTGGLPPILTLSVILVVLLFLAGCVKKTYNLIHIRTQLEALDEALGEAHYNNSAYGKTLQVSHIYEKYSHLITDQGLITYLGDIRDRERNTAERTRLAYLYAKLLEHYLGQRTKVITERITNIQNGEKIMVDGEEMIFRQVSGRLMNEPEREERMKLYRARGAVIEEKLNPLLLEENHLIQEISRELGYDDFAHMQEAARNDDFHRLERMAEDFLIQSEDIFRELLEQMSYRTLRLTLDEVRGWDRPRLFRAQELDGYFPKEKLLPFLRNTLSQMSLNLEEEDNIVIDIEDRAQKASGAACFPVSVPQDIRVLIKPVGGIQDYRALFHEMGHAQYYANIKSPEYEFRRLGEVAVTETYAVLLENLFMDRGFVRHHLNMSGAELDRLLERVLLDKLYLMRLYCGKFLYEIQLHREAKNPTDIYGLLMERATLLKRTDKEIRWEYLLCGDEKLRTVSHIKAWFLESQLRFYLQDQFGSRWFEREEAGRCLKDLWALGSAKPAEALARHLGFDGLEPSFLLNELKELYRSTQTSSR